MNSDFLILVLYDFIVQNILSSLLLLCYNLMIMNHETWKCADPELEKQIRCFPYVSRSVFERQQQDYQCR
jgi:hypothetical protein